MRIRSLALQSGVSRRRILAAGAATAAAACSGGRGEPVLNVFSWAGPWGRVFEEHLGPLFERATGATVRFDKGWGEEIPKLLIAPPGQPPYDVMIVAPFPVYAVIRRGQFLQLDWTKIPNAKRFHPRALDHWVAQEGWGLTWPDALHTGVYRRDLPSPPRDWREALDHQPGLYSASYMSLYTFAAAYAPGRAAEALVSDFEGVYAFARAQRRKVQHWWTTSPDMAFHLTQGHVNAGNIHSVNALAMMRRGQAVDLFVTEDRAHFQAIWLVPKGTRYPELAHEFINQFASEPFQRAYAAAGFPTPLPGVAREQAVADPLWARVNPHTDEHFASLHYYPYDAYTEHWHEMTERWNQEILV